MSAVYLSCKQVAKILDVSQSTIKRLCDDGVLTSLRTPGGHRRISLRSVQAWQHMTGRDTTQSAGAKREQPVNLTYSQCVEILLTQHRTVLCEVISRILLRSSMAQLCDQTLAPALVQLGWMHERGEIDSAQVQQACERMRGLLFHLIEALPTPGVDAPCAVGSTMTGDPADMPGLLAELTLRELGWNAEALSAGLNGTALARLASERQANLVWVCYTHQQSLAESIQQNRALLAELPPSTCVVIAGGALSPELRRHLTFDFFGDSLTHLSNYARGLQFTKAA